MHYKYQRNFFYLSTCNRIFKHHPATEINFLCLILYVFYNQWLSIGQVFSSGTW
jgi:hypothetical protein